MDSSAGYVISELLVVGGVLRDAQLISFYIVDFVFTGYRLILTVTLGCWLLRN
jgi:hypothetical protein